MAVRNSGGPTFDRDLAAGEVARLTELARLCRGDILKMTTIAGSGHPGGSMSSIEIYLTLYSCASIAAGDCDAPGRDRIVVSHGHTSPGLYACLARLGFIDHEDLLMNFRRLSGIYEGHIERRVPGVEWSTGNLGQGLSAGCGFALAARLNRLDYRTFVVMSDAEQAKGQVAEARRFAAKFGLDRLTVLIDRNYYQISGRTDDVMRVNIGENYLADGWKVREVDGHNFAAIHDAIRNALNDPGVPHAIIGNTVIGKGVSFMENCERYPCQPLGQAKYHGIVLSREECGRALAELGIEDDIDRLLMKKKIAVARTYPRQDAALPPVDTGQPRTYADPSDPRVVFGNALEETANLNPPDRIAVFDCDLAESVNTFKFARLRPANFFEAGVSEHATAAIAGALSICGIQTVWADFGVFAIDEAYNQLRLNDINGTNLKIIATHLGYNVGPDGKTHHCIDYVALIRNLHGFKIVIPADPNQTDHIVRYVLKQPGNWLIGMGRTKLPVVKREDGKIFYDAQYRFEYGAADLLRTGTDCTIFAMGATVNQALAVHELLKHDAIAVGVYAVSSPLRLDPATVLAAAAAGPVIGYEDHNRDSGLGSTIAQIAADAGAAVKLLRIGVSRYGGSDEADVLYKDHRLDAGSVAALVSAEFKK